MVVMMMVSHILTRKFAIKHAIKLIGFVKSMDIQMYLGAL